MSGVRRRLVSHAVPWAAVAAGAVAAIVAAVVVAIHHSRSPAAVRPVPHATTAAQQARNLEAWLRRYSR